MRREREQGQHYKLVFCVQILILVLLFLGITVVLVRVFSTSVAVSRQATDVNHGVQICRNAAEAFTAGGDVQDAVTTLGGTAGEEVLYFNREGMCVEKAASAYTLTLEQTEEQTQAGTMITAVFFFYDTEQQCVYSLTAQVYQPEGGV